MKMRYLLLVLFFPIAVTAQLKGVTTDAETGKPVAYVTIRTDDNMFGTSSAKNGEFDIPSADASGKIHFEVVGYEPLVIPRFTNGQKIALKKRNTKPRTVATLKRTESRRVGEIPEDYDPTQTSSIFTKPTILATHFPYSRRYDDTPYLSKVIVRLISKKEGAVFKVRIFDVDADGQPGDDVLNEDIIISTKEGEYNAEIDLSKYGIRFSETGHFIGVETIIIDENIAVIPWRTDNNDPESEIMREVHQPTFRGNSIRKGNLWRFYNNKWTHLEEKDKRKTSKGKYYPMNNLYLEIELSN